MSNLNVDFSKCGIEKNEYLKHFEVVEDVHIELIEKSKDSNEFVGWLDLPSKYFNSTEYKKIKECANKIQSDSDILLVIGIGGSYLGARAVIEALHSSVYSADKSKTKIIYVGNNLSPEYVNDVVQALGGKDFSINVISKSGTTTEPAIAFRIFRELLENKYGLNEARERIYVTTDGEKGALKHLAKTEKYQTFVIPDNVGGRFSVLTPVGLLPIAASGIDIDEIMKGAIASEKKYSDKSLENNECYQYAVIRNLLYEDGKSIEMLETFEPKVHFFIEWWKQLFGESEGKDGKGLFPAGAEFTTDLHSLGQYIQEGQRLMFETMLNFEEPNSDVTIGMDEDDLDKLNYLAGKQLSYVNKKAMEGTIKAHVDGGVPNILINVKQLTAETIGELIYFFEKACAMSAELLEVNPFNQPGVEKYKTNMFELLEKPGYKK
ncbi:MAG: glucose-6-phosphate isomerase [Clostridia bacterium]|nr:glucose-6-phosphate isomerase [Clostridia bacterium]